MKLWKLGAVVVGLMCVATSALAYGRSSSPARLYAGQSGWALTATQGTPLAGARALGLVPGNAQLRLVIALALRDRTGADLLLRRQNTFGDPLYHHPVTPAQFTAMFNPTNAQVSAVASCLTKQGFAHISVEPNNLLISATATAAQASTAFHTTIALFQKDGKVVYANTAPAYVPAELRGTVLAVLGLNNVIAFHKDLRYSTSMRQPSMGMQGRSVATPPPCTITTPTGICVGGVYTPQGYQKAYDVCKSCKPGTSTSIAVMAEGNIAQNVKDLRTFEKAFALPQVPYTIRPVGVPSIDVSGLDEWDLDTQTSTGIAFSVKHLYVYDTTSLTDSDTSLEFNHWVTDNLAQAGNASFGECEDFAFLDGSMLVDDQVFLQGASQGQTMFSSTGDNGNGCPVVVATGVPGTAVPENSYPATSPYVVGVGGTTLNTNADGTYNSEITWIGTGGGVSHQDYSPWWQGGVVLTLYRTVGKTIPDISMCADNNGCPALIYVNGAQAFVGGTSLSSPLSMGTWARLDTTHGNTLGFAAPLLYGVYDTATGCTPTSTACVPPAPPAGAINQTIGGYHDILVGSNGGPYGTLPGYDLETGLGSFDICKMVPLI